MGEKRNKLRGVKRLKDMDKRIGQEIKLLIIASYSEHNSKASFIKTGECYL